MAKYKVYHERTAVEYAIIEANSAEEAEQLADSKYSNYNWKDCEDSMTGSILIGETIKELEDE